ncbi:hypothetical protein IC619_012875 [Hazenella sp. IB182353]|uniref:hypothetical protein n=1 Tax=Polycladospora coralii TaxID=2771432 RepID=UPI0017471B0B|nr:hypothetical protein [Polycladospora coralii]MBS7531387.1 hypothetical protein [Polycladospora coralii]
MIKQLLLAGLVATSGMVGSANISHAAESLNPKPVITSNILGTSFYYTPFSVSPFSPWKQPGSFGIRTFESVNYTLNPTLEYPNLSGSYFVTIEIHDKKLGQVEHRTERVTHGEPITGTISSPFFNEDSEYYVKISGGNSRNPLKTDLKLEISR